MKKLTVVLALILAIALQTAFAGDIYHRRAVELRGGMSLYMLMEDPSDWAKQFYPNSTSDDMEFAPDFGLSILYKSHSNFVWNFGYNHHLAAKTTFGPGGNYEEIMDANEFFIVPSFLFRAEKKLNFSIGAGPTLIMAALDRNSPMAGNLGEFYGATGRNMGVLALVNLEYLLKPNFAFKVGAGFRSVIVNSINFAKNVAGTDYNYQVMWTDSAGNESSRGYELDFTGAFAEFGIRWYFTPKPGF